MNFKTILIAPILTFCSQAWGQVTNAGCIFLKTPAFDVFIPGYADSTQINGLIARIIETDSLENGFELVSNDSLVKVKGFLLVFDDEKTGTLYSKSTNSSKMIDDDRNIVPLSKLKGSTLITLDRIKVEYKGVCYTISGQVYYAK